MGAVGFVLLGRKDLPMFSKIAGRVLGNGVRGVRRMRKSVEEAARDGEVSEEMKGFKTLKSDMSESAAQVRSFGRTLRDELRPPNLDDPQEVKLSSKSLSQHKYQESDRNMSSQNSASNSDALKGPGNMGTDQIRRTVRGSASDGTGADIICSTIEEAAFSRKEAEMSGLKEALPKAKRE